MISLRQKSVETTSVPLLIIFVSALVFLPIFVSIDPSGGISFNRFGGYEEGYSLTFPLSIALLPLVAIFRPEFFVREILRNRFIPIFSLLSIFFLVLETQKLVILSCILFSLSYAACRALFSEGFKASTMSTVVRIGLISLSVPAIVSATFHIGFGGAWGFIGDNYAIYNYEQYFAFSINLIQIFIRPFHSVIFHVAFSSLAILVSIDSENDTALVLSIILLVMNLRSGGIPVRIPRLAVVSGFIIWLLVYPLIMSQLASSPLAGDPSVSGFWARAFTMKTLADNFNIHDILIPAALNNWFVSYGWSMHNQLMSVSVNYGLFLGLVYVVYWANQILAVNFPHGYGRRMLVFCVLTFPMVEALNHPFLAIQVAFLVAVATSRSAGPGQSRKAGQRTLRLERRGVAE